MFLFLSDISNSVSMYHTPLLSQSHYLSVFLTLTRTINLPNALSSNSNISLSISPIHSISFGLILFFYLSFDVSHTFTIFNPYSLTFFLEFSLSISFNTPDPFSLFHCLIILKLYYTLSLPFTPEFISTIHMYFRISHSQFHPLFSVFRAL